MKDGEMVTTYYVTLVDATGEREVPSYSPLGKDLKEDAPLPDGWEVKTSQKGKLYLAAPKAAGGGGKKDFTPRPAAWANTEEGEKYVQERMDRRTALMQAIALGPGDVEYRTSEIIALAEYWYAWLRKNLDVSAPRTGDAPSHVAQRQGTAGTQAAPPVGADTPLDGAGVEPGEASSPPSSKRTHSQKWTPNQPPKWPMQYP